MRMVESVSSQEKDQGERFLRPDQSNSLCLLHTMLRVLGRDIISLVDAFFCVAKFGVRDTRYIFGLDSGRLGAFDPHIGLLPLRPELYERASGHGRK